MSRLASTAPLGLGILLLAGCAQQATSQPIPAEPRTYVCKPTEGRGGEQHVTVRADEAGTGVLLSIGTKGEGHTLATVTGSNGQVYADAAYAWRLDGAAGVLTDIKNIRTYNCAGDGGPAK